MLSGFAAAYYQRDPRCEEFVSPRFDHADEWSEALAHASKRSIDPSVVTEIEVQQERFGQSPERRRNLSLLREPGACVVVTGQQLGLFLGPLYTIYKALTAVAWAKRLAAHSGTPVVPLFWLQTEDHDIAEVATYRSVDRDGQPAEFRLRFDPSSRVSIAHRRLPANIGDVVASLEASLDGLPSAQREVQRYRGRYQPDRGWVESFGEVLAEIFADEGLLVFNPRCAVVAAAAAPVHARAVEESAAIGRDLYEASKRLEARGFRVQVPVRPECALSFFHPEGPEGPRFRLKPRSSEHGLAGSKHVVVPAELEKALAHDSLCFSTSALLRPIVQDSVLPTVAYVGGPGEISYFAQLAPLYSRFDLPMPLIVPRRHFVVLEPPSRRALDALKLDAASLSPASLRATRRSHMALAPDEMLQTLNAELGDALDAVAPSMLAIDRGLERSLAQTRKTVRFAFGRLSARLESAQLNSNKVLESRLAVVESHLLPEGKRQERFHGVVRYCAAFGLQELKRALRDAPESHPGAFSVVEPRPQPTGGLL